MLGPGGIVERAATHLLKNICATKKRQFIIRASFLEIYNETVRDLLSTDSETLQIRVDPKKGVFCSATEMVVSDYDSIMNALTIGKQNSYFVKTETNIDIL